MKWKKSNEEEPKNDGFYFVKDHCKKTILYFKSPLTDTSSRLYRGWLDCDKPGYPIGVCKHCRSFEWLDEEDNEPFEQMTPHELCKTLSGVSDKLKGPADIPRMRNNCWCVW